METKKETTKNNKIIVIMFGTACITAALAGLFVYIAQNGNPSINLVIWIAGLIVYTWVNRLEEKTDIPKNWQLIRHTVLLIAIILTTTIYLS